MIEVEMLHLYEANFVVSSELFFEALARCMRISYVVLILIN